MVDDDPAVRDSLEFLLSMNGHRLTAAADGEEAAALSPATTLSLTCSSSNAIYQEGKFKWTSDYCRNVDKRRQGVGVKVAAASRLRQTFVGANSLGLQLDRRWP
jgi:hypothetical protein